jgi:hypothetical protein
MAGLCVGGQMDTYQYSNTALVTFLLRLQRENTKLFLELISTKCDLNQISFIVIKTMRNFLPALHFCLEYSRPGISTQ